jgi:capsular exopolysaccharide synthesis family protein
MSDSQFDGDSADAAPSRTGAARGESGGRFDSRDVHLIDYVKVLYKRRWTAIMAFVLVVGTATVNTFTATPIYQARTRLLIETENPNVVSFKAVVEENQARLDYYLTQYSILQSRALARRTLNELDLWKTPPFGGKPRPPGLARRVIRAPFRVVGAVVGLLTPNDQAANAVPDADETAAQSRAIDVFLARLAVVPIRASRLVDITYQLPDAVLATRIVNTLARKYIEQNLEYKFLASKEASDWLGQRLAEQRQQVEAAEAKLQRYREQNDAISLKDRENLVVQKLADLNALLTQAKTERFQKEAVYNQLQGLRGDTTALDTFPAIQANTFIQQQKAELTQLQTQYAQLGEKLGPNHPEMVKLRSAIQIAEAKLSAEIGKVVQAVKNEYLAALAKENSLSAALDAQKNDALAMNRKAIDYSVLDREVQSSRQIYDSLLQRAKETGVSTELKTSNIRVVDVAERPLRPISPKRSLTLMLALVGGSLLACALVFFFEYMDSRIKTPDEVKTHLGLPHIGLLPALGRNDQEPYPLVNNGVAANFSEAFRTIRTNVLFATAQEGSRSLVVTSTGPGEGKSVVASNLAISLAQARQRVLLLDADMRRPRVHIIFEKPQEPGLSNVLVGDAKPAETIHRTTVPGLSVMASGLTPPDPAELLGSKRFQDFMSSLAPDFDWVIVDTPPVMAVTDSSVAAHVTGSVLFVIGAEMTSRYEALRALEQLEHMNAKFMGAVLNRVDLQHHGYYYSKYYRRKYGEYYTPSSSSSKPAN